eukprot:TRINITY_DN11696_c0_g3_i1.p1 TRINITY_DN11696_c0_g3~~TRINITY_DN11696_c0_g3_i1.p1  ORF type:complete len:880 (+),score=277.35 TRINITY_DN11696_c0_g3_i1:104-2743(+)
MGAACGRCADAAARLVAKEGDTPADRAAKRIAAPVLMYVGAAAIIAILVSQLNTQVPDSWTIGFAFLSLISIAGGVALAKSRWSVRDVGAAVSVAYCCSILVADANNAAAMNPRIWSFVVLILDLALVLGLMQWVQLVIIGLTLAYLAVERFEAVFRPGLYELTFLGYGRPGVTTVCDCGQPPCGVTIASGANALLGFSIVFLMDYGMTRGFAIGLRKQMELIDASISVAERVSVLLAKYAVDEAELVVSQDGEKLPEALRYSMERLLDNLRSYRPYLPDSLLQCEDGSEGGEEDGARIDPPGLDSDDDPHVCLCFTDIESSTALWEAQPQGMYDALQIHNRVMRRAAAVCGGYEVKTIGDAFMFCFATTEGACRFALEAQRQLLRQQWPPDLLELDLCRPLAAAGPEGEDLMLWNGLRVRIGINCGGARVQRNPVTGRCDYFGGTVNVAARVEAAVQRGGLIGVTNAVLDDLGGGGLAALGSPAVIPIGPRQLKGVRGEVTVSLLLPPELAPRAGLMALGAQGAACCRIATMRSFSSQQSSECSASRSSALADMIAAHEMQSSSSMSITVQRSPGQKRKRSGNLQQQGALGLKLKHSRATSAAVRLPLAAAAAEGGTAGHLAALEAAADVTRGVVFSVVSCSVVVAWNASSPCPEHAAGCAQFMRALQRDPRVIPCHTGAATDLVLSGNVAAGRRRWATVIGGCIELSAALAEEAELCADVVLATGPVVDAYAMGGNVHRAQLWLEGANTFVVWEMGSDEFGSSSRQETGVDGAGELSVSRWADLLLDSDAPQGSAPLVADDDPLPGVFLDAAGLSEEQQVEMFQRLCDESRDDRRAFRLLQRAREGRIRSRRVPPISTRDLDSPCSPTSPGSPFGLR